MIWRRPARTDEGAALVETAIIIWTLLLIAFGIVDYGLMFRHQYSLAGAARTGARTGATAGNEVDADWQIVKSIVSSRSTIDNGNILRVVVFKADDADGRIPESCKTTATVGVCNVFEPMHLDMAKNDQRDMFLASGAASSWPATSRASSALTDTDFIGVWVLSDFDYATGIFGSSKRIADTTVMRIDPKRGNIMTSGSTLPPPPATTTTTAPTTTTTAPTTTAPTTAAPSTTAAPTTTRPPTTTTRPPTTTTRPPTTTTRPPATTAAPTTTRPPTTTTRPPTTTTTRPPTTTTRPPTTTTTRPTTTTTTFRRGGG